jgi:hypothetical protein
MKLDLENLRAGHPRLLPEHAADLALHAGVALQAQGHVPGVRAVTRVNEEPIDPSLHWQKRAADAHETLDPKRVTELGAEAVALALVHAVRKWVVRRRLPEGESADWLLQDETGAFIALEVSGTGTGDAKAVLRKKLAQVSKNDDGGTLSACVVRFEEPAVWLQDVARESR